MKNIIAVSDYVTSYVELFLLALFCFWVILLMRDHLLATQKIFFTTIIAHMHTALRTHTYQSFIQYLHPVHTFGAHSHSCMHAQMYECITHISIIAQDARLIAYLNGFAFSVQSRVSASVD